MRRSGQEEEKLVVYREVQRDVVHFVVQTRVPPSYAPSGLSASSSVSAKWSGDLQKRSLFRQGAGTQVVASVATSTAVCLERERPRRRAGVVYADRTHALGPRKDGASRGGVVCGIRG